MDIILGLRSKHDASAALVMDGKLVAAAAEERFTRKKHYYGFPLNAIEYVLSEAGINAHQVNLIARDGLPWRKTISRLTKQLYTAWTPRLYREVLSKGLYRYFLRKEDLKKSEELQLSELGFNPNWYFVEHHLAHAAYAYFTSALRNATIVVMDGRGHYLSGGIYHGHDDQITTISEILAEGGSMGLFYSAVTDALGFQVGDGDGKTMGLACYGEPQTALQELSKFAPAVDKLQVKRNKEWELNTKVIDSRLYAHYEESAELRLMIDEFGDANIAAAAQLLLEQRLEQLVMNAIGATGNRNLIAGGGIFLNIKANKNLLDHGIVDNIYIPPGPGDEGLAAGYALAAYAEKYFRIKPLKSAYLGPEFSDEQILAALKGSEGIEFEKIDDIHNHTAALIAEGFVIGWFQGRMEWGPRALGNRSVLADPRDPNMRDRINKLLKKRDWFMPFAPSVLKEYCEEYFIHYQQSPYMNLAFELKQPYDKLVPAIMHVDHTARPQEVDRETNLLYYKTIEAFYQKTGIPMVLNTSFNRHGLPIVCNPKQAIEHLQWGSVDMLAIGSYIVTRSA